jgi:hypothetical protein
MHVSMVETYLQWDCMGLPAADGSQASFHTPILVYELFGECAIYLDYIHAAIYKYL